MSKSRTEITMAAFRRMDRTGDGIITVHDLKGYVMACSNLSTLSPGGLFIDCYLIVIMLSILHLPAAPSVPPFSSSLSPSLLPPFSLSPSLPPSPSSLSYSPLRIRVYNARKHPKYVNGDWTETQVFEDYLKSFDSPNDPDGKVACLPPPFSV